LKYLLLPLKSHCGQKGSGSSLSAIYEVSSGTHQETRLPNPER